MSFRDCKGCKYLDSEGKTDMATYPCGHCNIPSEERVSYYEIEEGEK